jgi:hypothetical protein
LYNIPVLTIYEHKVLCLIALLKEGFCVIVLLNRAGLLFPRGGSLPSESGVAAGLRDCAWCPGLTSQVMNLVAQLWRSDIAGCENQFDDQVPRFRRHCVGGTLAMLSNSWRYLHGAMPLAACVASPFLPASRASNLIWTNVSKHAWRRAAAHHRSDVLIPSIV